MSESLRRQISSPVALFVFEAVARHGGFRAAALELNVTQPSVSYQIKNLEKHLGTMLFARRGRSISLTEDGETLYRAIERGFAAIQTGLAEIAHRASGNLVTFCISSSAAANFVLPRYPALRQALPKLDLSIKIVRRCCRCVPLDKDDRLVRGQFAIASRGMQAHPARPDHQNVAGGLAAMGHQRQVGARCDKPARVCGLDHGRVDMDAPGRGVGRADLCVHLVQPRIRREKRPCCQDQFTPGVC